MGAAAGQNWSLGGRPVSRFPGVNSSTIRARGKSEENLLNAVNSSMPSAGDAAGFRTITDSFVRELRVHCYRMLGSAQDAEDALQETLLAAWRGLAAYEGRASLRTWLYRIATNRCLDARRAASRRPAKQWDVPALVPRPSGYGEVTWLEPFPDSLLDGADGAHPGPAARYQQAEAISLAFVVALQTLPPRQVAVLILRDVLDFHASEVADMLDTTLDAVNGALKRARASMQQRFRGEHEGRSIPAGGSPNEQAVVARFVKAWEGANIDALVELLTDDVFISMPPIPYEYRGRVEVIDFCASLFAAGRRFDLVPSRANGQPAFGVYLRSASGSRPGVGMYVLEIDNNQVRAMTRFEAGLLLRFDLPRQLLGR